MSSTVDLIISTLRVVVDQVADDLLLKDAYRTGYAVQCGDVTGRVIELDRDLVTIQSVYWSRRDPSAWPRWSVRTFRRSNFTNVIVAPAVRPFVRPRREFVRRF